MKEKGFTLIELLAVIVILAIIALIATPIILGIIEVANEESIERSVENYLKAVNIAIAKENLNREFKPNTCEVQSTGNLLCGNETEPITIEVDGKAPSSGKITFTNGSVSNYENLYIDGKYANKGNDGVVVSTNKQSLCTPVEVSTLGNVPSGNYSLGDEYTCNLGDGIKRTFYLLENGSNPVEGSTLSSDEVALIMSENIDSTRVTWCKDGDTNNSCAADGALEHLEEQTNGWTSDKIVDISLPTYNQINNATYRDEDEPWNFVFYEWTNIGKYYWTLSPGLSGQSAYMFNNGFSDEYLGNSPTAFVRPIIIIPKDQLG